MSKQVDTSFPSPASLKILRRFLIANNRLLERACHRALDRNDFLWSRTLAPLMMAAAETVRSLLLLGQGKLARDSYVAARTIIETLINIVFILARGEAAARRAHSYRHQRAFRDLQRQLDVAGRRVGITWTGRIPIPTSQLKADLDTFTGRKGREVRRWTDESVVERLAEVVRKFPSHNMAGLQMSLLAIYAPASEIAHGSLFGVSESLGLNNPAPTHELPTADYIDEHTRSAIGMLYISIAGDVASVLSILAEALGDEALGKQAATNWRIIDGVSWRHGRLP